MVVSEYGGWRVVGIVWMVYRFSVEGRLFMWKFGVWRVESCNWMVEVGEWRLVFECWRLEGEI